MDSTSGGSAVVWITGLSGSGKSTLGGKVCQRLREAGKTVVFLDGDNFRSILGDDLSYDPESRKKNAFRIARTCKFLSDQGVMVVCATMSLYPEVWAWNQDNIEKYIEVYLLVDKQTLIARDPKGLYRAVLRGEERFVVGIDIPFNEPTRPALTIVNDDAPDSIIEERVSKIVSLVN